MVELQAHMQNLSTVDEAAQVPPLQALAANAVTALATGHGEDTCEALVPYAHLFLHMLSDINHSKALEQCAAAAICKLASKETSARALVEAGCPPILMQTLRAAVCSSSSSITTGSSAGSRHYYSAAALLASTRPINSSVQYVAEAIKHLAKHQASRQALVDAGIIPVLHDVLRIVKQPEFMPLYNPQTLAEIDAIWGITSSIIAFQMEAREALSFAERRMRCGG